MPAPLGRQRHRLFILSIIVISGPPQLVKPSQSQCKGEQSDQRNPGFGNSNSQQSRNSAGGRERSNPSELTDDYGLGAEAAIGEKQRQQENVVHVRCSEQDRTHSSSRQQV